jgi:hypothetical protein
MPRARCSSITGTSSRTCGSAGPALKNGSRSSERDQKGLIVNQYGTLALQHWKQWLPARYAAISDPEDFFSALGEQVAAEIASTWAEMSAAEGNPAGESYLDRVGRLNMIRKQAEETVLDRLVLLPPDPPASRGASSQDGSATGT